MFELSVWGALTVVCSLLCCILSWGTVLALRTQPGNSLLIFSGAFLTGSMAVYTGASFYHSWRWGSYPACGWMGRVAGVTGWMWIVYFGLLIAGVWLAEGGSIFLPFAGFAIALFGLVRACRKATEPAEPTDPIYCQLWEIEEWYRENVNDEEKVQQLSENLCELTQWLEWDEEWDASDEDDDS